MSTQGDEGRKAARTIRLAVSVNFDDGAFRWPAPVLTSRSYGEKKAAEPVRVEVIRETFAIGLLFCGYGSDVARQSNVRVRGLVGAARALFGPDGSVSV
jgi:hypothetical protein